MHMSGNVGRFQQIYLFIDNKNAFQKKKYKTTRVRNIVNDFCYDKIGCAISKM